MLGSRPSLRAGTRSAAVMIGLLVLSLSPLLGQSDSLQPSGYILSGIAVHGNEVTRPEVIVRELTLKRGDVISDEEVQYSRQRVYSLGLFNRVEMEYPPMDSTTLVISVHERLYFYPVPIAEIVDRDLRHLRLGLGVVHNNLGGWNQRLWVGTAFGYNPMAQVRYVTPWLFGSGDYTMDLEFKFEQTRNKSPLSESKSGVFHETRYQFVQNYGRRWDSFLYSWIMLGAHYVEAPGSPADHLISEQGIDRSVVAGIGTKYDSRDLREYPSRGLLLQSFVTQRLALPGSNAITTLSSEIAHYFPVSGPVFAGLRWTSRLQAGDKIPRYEYSFFGYSERIRGWWDTVFEGENMMSGSVEFNLPLLTPRYFTIPGMPIPEFALWRVAVYLAAFMDAGLVWNRGERLAWDSLPFGYGVGLHVLLPYSFVARGDVAMNNLGKPDYILDISIRL